MTAKTTSQWTLDELGARVALALSVDYEGQSNRQISDIPNGRTIRYYTTLGLVDRPSRMRGRTGLYGRRHLRQIVAIKRLQLRGLTLAQIQETLAGASEEELRELAAVPEEVEAREESTAVEPTGGVVGVDRRADSFWRSAPASMDAAAPETRAEPEPWAPEREPSEGSVAPVGAAPDELLRGIRLGQDVTLLLSARRRLYEDDIRAVEAAAAPLMKLLRQRGLIGPPPWRRDP